jgi:DNA polymerase-3 subunit alpha
VGEAAVRCTIEARESSGRFTDLFDFAKREDPKQLNRRVLEALIKCGALDGLPNNRAEKLAAMEAALEMAARAARDSELGQASLFGETSTTSPLPAPRVPAVAAPSTHEMLAWEKETLGIFVSGHPLAGVQAELLAGGATLVKDLGALDDDAPVTVAGIVTGVRRTLTKSGQQLLIAQIEDTSGACDVVVFSKLYGQVHELFKLDAILIVRGRLRLRERRGSAPGEEAPLELSVAANDVAPFIAPAPRPVRRRAWHVEVTQREQIDRLATLIETWPGDVPVVMHVSGRTQRAGRAIGAGAPVRAQLEGIFGTTGVREEADDAFGRNA